MSSSPPLRHAFVAALLALAAALAPAARAAAQTPAAPVELTLVSYAVAKPFFAKVIPEFQKAWKAQAGQDVRFKESYGPSGAQTRAVVGGLEADVVATNLQSLVTPLVDAGLVKADWATRLPNGASPASSVIAVIVRAGNPKKIRTWDDIALPGVEIVAINPKTSGNARWGVLAGYGALLREKDQKAASAPQRAVPEVLGLIATISTPGKAMSAQVRSLFGCPARTMTAMT